MVVVWATRPSKTQRLRPLSQNTMSFEHQREMAELNAQLRQLRAEVDELKVIAGVRDPNTRLN